MTSTVDIRPDHLEIVRDILREHLPTGVKVWVFGSRANWTTKDSSDLNLALEGETRLSRKLLGALKDAFEDSTLPYTVDVVDLGRIGDSFRRIVVAQRTPLPMDANGTGRQGRLSGAVVSEGASGGAAFGVSSGKWREMPFSKAVEVNPSVHLDRGETYPFIDMAAVNPGSRSAHPSDQREFRGGGSRFRDGDILMARITPCLENGKIARYRARDSILEAHGSTEFIVIRGRQDVTDNEFAYYLTQWNDFREYAISQMTGTSGRQRVPVGSLDHMTVSIPPLPEQRAIAHILGTLDDKIELNRRLNETLEEMARTLFKSWFVDFDSVRAKMEGRDTGLPKSLADLFPDRLVDSELGPIPEGWEVKALGDVIEIHDSRRVPLNSRERASRQGPYPYYGATGIMDYVDDFLFDGVYVLAGEDGSVIDTDGCPVVQYVWGQFWVNNHAHVLRGRNGIGQEHLYLLLQRVSILPFVTGAVQQKLSQRNLKAIPLVFPGGPASRTFSTLVGPLFERMRDSADEAESLATQRDILLSKLMSGEPRAVGYS